MSDAMYCGDEVATVVGDIGSDTSKFGYGGEDSPKHVFSSTAGYLPPETSIREGAVAGLASMEVDGADVTPHTSAVTAAAAGPASAVWSKRRPGGRWLVGDLAISRRRDGMEMKSPLEDGLLSDWEQVEKLWEHAFHQRLRAVPSERPILSGEASWSTAKERRGLMELMFEKFGVPAMFPAKNAMLSAFSAGRSTALVCDCGHEASSAVPVVDGFVLNRAVQRGIRGGAWLTRQTYEFLTARGIQIQPRYAVQRGATTGDIKPRAVGVASASSGSSASVKGKGKGKARGRGGRGARGPSAEELFPGTTRSYASFMRLEIVRELKETVMCVPPEETVTTSSDEDEPQETESYLPDGTKIEARQKTEPEPASGVLSVMEVSQFLTDELRHIPEKMMGPAAMGFLQDTPQDNLKLDLSLPALLRRALEKSDADARKEMAGNVVLTGAGSLFDGMPERITSELTESLPSAFKVRTLTASPIERRFSVWIGGSILCSLGTFQQLWLSKRQYEEQGPEMAESRRFQG